MFQRMVNNGKKKGIYYTISALALILSALVSNGSVHANPPKDPSLLVSTARPMPDPGWPGLTLAGVACRADYSKPSNFGPFDYTNPGHRGTELYLVESTHFTMDVETLRKGHSAVEPDGDLDYTLRAFPNHHRALYAMGRYQLRTQGKTKHAKAECYFQRALKLKPNDHRVYQLYAHYLKKKKKLTMALKIYQQATNYKPVPGDMYYSLGMLQFNMKNYSGAVESAKLAKEAGFKKTTLINKLKAAKQWPSS